LAAIAASSVIGALPAAAVAGAFLCGAIAEILIPGQAGMLPALLPVTTLLMVILLSPVLGFAAAAGLPVAYIAGDLATNIVRWSAEESAR
jgi:hypothetical protein